MSWPTFLLRALTTAVAGVAAATARLVWKSTSESMTSHRWRGTSTSSSSCGHREKVASMAWGASKFDFYTVARSADAGAYILKFFLL